MAHLAAARADWYVVSMTTDAATGTSRSGSPVVDFRRPAPLLAEQAAAIRAVHDELAERLSPMLSSRLRTPCRLTVTNMEMVSYEDLAAALADNSVGAICELRPLPSPTIVRVPLPLAGLVVDLLLGGPGRVDPEPNPLTEIELQVLRRLVEHCEPSITDSWRPLVRVHPEVIGLTSDATHLAVSPGEPILRVDLQFELGGNELALDIWVPNSVLATALRGLEPALPSAPPAASTSFRDVIVDVLRSVDVELTVEFPPVRMRSADILAVEVGDTIRLQSTSEPLILRAGDVVLGTVRPARRDDRTACQVTSVLQVPLSSTRRPQR